MTPAEWDALTPEGRGPCEEWPGPRHAKSGYGRDKWEGRTLSAHRVAWFRAYGPLPPSVHVLHHCDNRPCVRLSHLYAGSAADNAKDRERRHRSWASQKQECPQGHSLVEIPYELADGSKRWCPICRAEQYERYRTAHLEEIRAKQRELKRATYEADPEKYRARARAYYAARQQSER